jgi:hypothetical protein
MDWSRNRNKGYVKLNELNTENKLLVLRHVQELNLLYKGSLVRVQSPHHPHYGKKGIVHSFAIIQDIIACVINSQQVGKIFCVFNMAQIKFIEFPKKNIGRYE